MYNKTNHTIKSPCLFDVNKTCTDYVTNQNEKYDLFHIKYYFKLIFNYNQITNIYISYQHHLFSLKS